MNKSISVTCAISKRDFFRFAMYDAFIVKKRLRTIAVFALMMLAFACVPFAFAEKDGATLLGTVLTCVGVGLPAVYVASFMNSVRLNAKKQRLPREVYAISLTASEVAVRPKQNAKDEVNFKLSSAWAAYRVKACTYLYATPNNAFLLPDGQSDATDAELWNLIKNGVQKGRAFGNIKKEGR